MVVIFCKNVTGLAHPLNKDRDILYKQQTGLDVMSYDCDVISRANTGFCSYCAENVEEH